MLGVNPITSAGDTSENRSFMLVHNASCLPEAILACRKSALIWSVNQQYSWPAGAFRTLLRSGELALLACLVADKTTQKCSCINEIFSEADKCRPQHSVTFPIDPSRTRLGGVCQGDTQVECALQRSSNTGCTLYIRGHAQKSQLLAIRYHSCPNTCECNAAFV